jgi:hypothetical protein
MSVHAFLTRFPVDLNGQRHAPTALSAYLFGLQRLSEVVPGGREGLDSASFSDGHLADKWFTLFTMSHVTES